MITHKQYPNHHIFETEIGGRTFTVETGKVAELCNAEAICRYGDTVVLVTAVASPLPKAGIDYFPLTIEVEERMYAVGRIPGSFNRREGKPSDRGVLISRLIDRPMRPLFDEELRNDVVLAAARPARPRSPAATAGPCRPFAARWGAHRSRYLQSRISPAHRPP